jgi:hypothetical protein
LKAGCAFATDIQGKLTPEFVMTVTFSDMVVYQACRLHHRVADGATDEGESALF